MKYFFLLMFASVLLPMLFLMMLASAVLSEFEILLDGKSESGC